jgi:molecular chaperone GrpE
MADDVTMQPDAENPASPDPNIPLQIPELTELDMLSNKIVELEKSIEQLKDQLLRKAAEFENYKKRVENDYASVVKYSNESLIESLLPVIDDFERSLKASRAKAESGQVDQPGGDENSIIRGIELVYNKFTKILEKLGVKSFDVVGKPFDPHLHDALLQIPNNTVPPHTVLEEVEKGYTLHDKVIRHAKVVVSADQSDGQEEIQN